MGKLIIDGQEFEVEDKKENGMLAAIRTLSKVRSDFQPSSYFSIASGIILFMGKHNIKCWQDMVMFLAPHLAKHYEISKEDLLKKFSDFFKNDVPLEATSDTWPKRYGKCDKCGEYTVHIFNKREVVLKADYLDSLEDKSQYYEDDFFIDNIWGHCCVSCKHINAIGSDSIGDELADGQVNNLHQAILDLRAAYPVDVDIILEKYGIVL